MMIIMLCVYIYIYIGDPLREAAHADVRRAHGSIREY